METPHARLQCQQLAGLRQRRTQSRAQLHCEWTSLYGFAFATRTPAQTPPAGARNRGRPSRLAELSLNSNCVISHANRVTWCAGSNRDAIRSPPAPEGFEPSVGFWGALPSRAPTDTASVFAGCIALTD